MIESGYKTDDLEDFGGSILSTKGGGEIAIPEPVDVVWRAVRAAVDRYERDHRWEHKFIRHTTCAANLDDEMKIMERSTALLDATEVIGITHMSHDDLHKIEHERDPWGSD